LRERLSFLLKRQKKQQIVWVVFLLLLKLRFMQEEGAKAVESSLHPPLKKLKQLLMKFWA